MSVSAKRSAGSVEFDLLCLIACPNPALGQARQMLCGAVDFLELFRLAQYHGVRPQLIESLHKMAWETVPVSARTSFENFRRYHGAHALFVSEQLCRLAAKFSEAGLRFAAFKGPTLAKALYGDVSCREYVDLDVIVPEQQVDEAERLLGSLGYCAAAGDRSYRHAFLGYLRQYAFVHPGNGVAIDLHWNFTGIHVPFPLTPAEAWRDLGSVSIGNHAIPTVAGENLALLLAGHGTKEAWRCLGWVCDFSMLIDRHPDLDWRRIHERAKARRCGDAVLLACAMSQELLGTPVPRALLGLLEKSGRVHALVERLTRDLRKSPPDPAGQENFSDFHLCERRIDKLLGAIRLALTRTSGDYDMMKLPPALWSIYYATRPFRLGAKALANLALRATN
ncbi:MAG: nucleotidyltransferase family protein [bacterium]|nr:nucleotidyltransferase family protein [bacterium]